MKDSYKRLLDLVVETFEYTPEEEKKWGKTPEERIKKFKNPKPGGIGGDPRKPKMRGIPSRVIYDPKGRGVRTGPKPSPDPAAAAKK